MPIGEYEKYLYKNRVARFLRATFGTPGLHDHIRIAPLLDNIRRFFPTKDRFKVVEIGSGGGLNLFEIGKIRNVEAEGYDLDPEHVTISKRIAGCKFPGFRFYQADATTLPVPAQLIDLLLFMDVIEHVPNPQRLLERMSQCVKPRGLIFVSVPTPRYPHVFGREMHNRIGHLLDGYSIQELALLFPSDCKLIHHSYNTGAIVQLACAFQTRVLYHVPNERLRWLLSLPLLIFKYCDWINGPTVSCSLFAVFEKG